MFGIGSSEILIVLLIALLVLGPNELPRVARSLARALRTVQRATDDIRHTVTAELALDAEEEEKLEKMKALARREADEGKPAEREEADAEPASSKPTPPE